MIGFLVALSFDELEVMYRFATYPSTTKAPFDTSATVYSLGLSRTKLQGMSWRSNYDYFDHEDDFLLKP